MTDHNPEACECSLVCPKCAEVFRAQLVEFDRLVALSKHPMHFVNVDPLEVIKDQEARRLAALSLPDPLGGIQVAPCPQCACLLAVSTKPGRCPECGHVADPSAQTTEASLEERLAAVTSVVEELREEREALLSESLRLRQVIVAFHQVAASRSGDLRKGPLNESVAHEWSVATGWEQASEELKALEVLQLGGEVVP